MAGRLPKWKGKVLVTDFLKDKAERDLRKSLTENGFELYNFRYFPELQYPCGMMGLAGEFVSLSTSKHRSLEFMVPVGWFNGEAISLLVHDLVSQLRRLKE